MPWSATSFNPEKKAPDPGLDIDQETALAKKADTSEAPPTLKEQMDALAHIVEKLEDPDVALEESLALYEQGMALVTTAGKVLEAAEQRVAMVTGDGEVQAIDP